jgi:hypothetical protein
MNKKATATARTTSREDALISYLNGGLLMKEDADKFACSEDAIGKLYSELQKREPGFSHCTKAGGLGNHRDFDIHVGGVKKGIELKTSEKKVHPALLLWQPWEGAVEFAQGQLTSKLMGSFLGDCGLPMIAAWHERVINVFMPQQTPELTKPTLEDYTKVLFTIGAEKKDTPAASLIRTLRANDEKRSILQQEWLHFEDDWFSSHQPIMETLEEVLRKILEEKDYWININKEGAFLIEGFLVKGLTYVGTAKKKQGGTVYRYKMALQKKSGGEIQQVPFVLKFYWKNGGQAVQNLNLLMVSDTFD